MKEYSLTVEIVRWLLAVAAGLLLIHLNSSSLLWSNFFALTSFVSGILALGGLAGSVRDNLSKVGSNVKIWLYVQLFSFVAAVVATLL